VSFLEIPSLYYYHDYSRVYNHTSTYAPTSTVCELKELHIRVVGKGLYTGEKDPLHFKGNAKELVIDFIRILWSSYIYI
jgi:hypothetical protein